jgi:hypothetical protein
MLAHLEFTGSLLPYESHWWLCAAVDEHFFPAVKSTISSTTRWLRGSNTYSPSSLPPAQRVVRLQVRPRVVLRRRERFRRRRESRVRNHTPIFERVDLHLYSKLFTNDVRIHLRNERSTVPLYEPVCDVGIRTVGYESRHCNGEPTGAEIQGASGHFCGPFLR